MEQLSRPYQIALGVLALFALVWFVALHRPGSSASAPAPAVAQTSSAAKSPGAPSSVYHGAAPGVEGLTRAIAKAHGAVATSEENAKQLQSKSAAASGETTTHAGTASSSSSSSSSVSHSKGPSGSPAAAKQAKQSGPAGALQRDLSHGKVVVLMFWNPWASDDRATKAQLQDLARHEKGIAVKFARATEVAKYGSFTQGVEVFQTPTLLVIGPKGQTETLTGFNDASAIRQTVANARQGGAGAVQAPVFTAWTPKSGRAKTITTAQKTFCSKTHFTVPTITSVAQLSQVLADITKFQAARYAKVERVAPAADRPFVKRMFNLYNVGIAEIREAIGTPLALSRRALVFSAQSKFDEAENGLRQYGLTDCH